PGLPGGLRVVPVQLEDAAREARARADRLAGEVEVAREHARQWREAGEADRAARDTALEGQRVAEAAAAAAREEQRRAADETAAAQAGHRDAQRRVTELAQAAAGDRAARERAERELLTAVERAEGERALRERADAELERLRIELAEVRTRHAVEVRGLLTGD
ncbi:hypothetical protein, partial [Pseudonocardia hydrocarbonoxydans]|uniref:hypothetical protein n=1 Tax=Pseudonocardia hydrocarbonoxydans TaxID=76726 RepID=UPI00351A1BA3